MAEYHVDYNFNQIIQMEPFQSFHQKLPDAIHGAIQRILRDRASLLEFSTPKMWPNLLGMVF